MKAAEAKALTDSVNDTTEVLDCVLGTIKSYANQGCYSVEYCNVLPEHVREQLRALGYFVGETRQTELTPFTKISWA